MDQVVFQQPPESFLVGLRVRAFGFSGGEALNFMFFVERLYRTVYPPETEGFFDGVVVSDAFFARRFMGKYKPDFPGRLKAIAQPLTPIIPVLKILCFLLS